MEQRGDGKVISSLILILFFSIFVLSILALPAFAASTTTFELSPFLFYEGTFPTFNFTITTSHLTKQIDEINISTESAGMLSLTNDSQFNQGWDAILGTSSILWKNNSIPKGSFVIYTYLQFSAKLPQVSADRTEQWQIFTIDNKGAATANTVNVTIKNDATPPVLSNLYPAPSGYLRGAQNPVSVHAVDAESGIASAAFNFSTCGGNATITALEKIAGTDNYSATADFSQFSEGFGVCFSFFSSSNGGEQASAGGNFTIDNTPPAVTAAGPVDNAFIPAAPNLSFFASDRISPSLLCDVILDGAAVARESITNQPQAATPPMTAIVANASDGSHQWSVACTDLAGNSGASQQRIVKVDTIPPSIFFGAIPLIIRGRQNIISAAITDFSGISMVASHVAINATTNQTVPVAPITSLTASSESSASGSMYGFTLMPEPTAEGAYQLSVHAEDGVGHAAAASIQYNVTYNYAINVTAPPAVPGSDVTITGTVRLDNGSLAKETGVALDLAALAKPGFGSSASTVVVPLDSTGSFSYTATAPAAEGNYPIIASVASANGITYNGSSSLSVEQAESPVSYSPGSGRGKRRSAGESSGSAGADAASGVASITGAATGISAAPAASSTAPASSASPTSAQASTPSGGTGVGRAGGFLTAALLKHSKLIWTIIVVALVIGVLVYISRGPEGPAVAVRRGGQNGASSTSPPSSSAFSPSFQQQIREGTTRHDLDLDEYLRSRLER